MSKYDVFISYRRDGGDSFAMILKNELKSRGLKVFHDIESLRSGDFNRQLYSEIENADKFVLVLPPSALDRCLNDKKDWVRLEIEHAIACEKVIIPIMLRGFSFPAQLPAPLDLLPHYQGLEPRMDHTFDSSMDYLMRLIKDSSLEASPEDLAFDMRKVRIFSSCGSESTIFKVKKSENGNEVAFAVNFEKTRLRDEIPEYAGAYYLKHPALDLHQKEQILFDACSPDQSIAALWVEIKPAGKAWMHEIFEFELSEDYQECAISLRDFEYPETLRCVEEITFVLKPVSFADENCLKGSFCIKNLRIF